MAILLTILIAIVGIITLLLLLALFMKKKHYVQRSVVIHAPQQKVFDYIKFLKNQDAFNQNAMTDPDRIRHFKGTDGTIGYTYSWSGDKSAGEGEKEILDIVEGKSVETEIRFTKPMVTSARIIMDTEALADGDTKVYWSNAGKLNYPVNVMIPMLEKSVAKGMDESLGNLKRILEA